jgi:hypothetical protein
LPSPRAYAPTYNITLASTSKGAVRSDRGISSYADADDDGFFELRSEGIAIKWNPTLQSKRPTDMIGMDQRRIRLLPIRSIRRRAAHVMMKLVTATVREVKVGLSKPSMVKMVAEKYIKEFCGFSQLRSQC